MADKSFYCQPCDCTLNNKKEYDQHCKGKKHISNERLAHEHDVANRRVFVSGIDGIRDPHGALKAHFLNYGKLENISIGNNNGNSFAFVEFSSPESVSKVLNMKHRIGGHFIYVKRFKYRPSPWESKRLVHQELEQDEKTKQAQTKNHMMEILMSAENLNDQISLVAENLKLEPHDQKARVRICEELASLFAPHFENCKVYQFGSSVNGFGAKGCDLDLFLDLNIQGSSNDLKKSKVKTLAQIVGSSKSFIKTLTIPSLRCPVVRFVHKASDIKCDLSINNRKALHNSYLLRLYGSDPRVHKLVSIIRLWAKSQGLSGSASGAHLFTSYAITLIVIFFLMHRKPRIIPLVCDVEKVVEGTSREMVDDWECLSIPSNAKLPPSENKDTDVDLVKEFFTFCSDTVNWDCDALVMKDASIIKRSSISQDPSFIGCKAGCMTVLDPFILTHNVVANVNEKTKIKFVAELKRAVKLTSEWSDCFQKTGPDPWGIAALLVPNPDHKTNTTGKKSGPKATKTLATEEGKSGEPARVTKNNTTRVEGEQENGDFCITVQPLSQTMSCAKLLLTAKQNNRNPAEQWCIMAQKLILDVLKTVFMVEVEEAELTEAEVKMMEGENKDKNCQEVNLTTQPGDGPPGDRGMKDVGSPTEGLSLKCIEKDIVCDENEVADGARNAIGERKDKLHETTSGKRTSDAAHLDGNGTESVDNSRIDCSSVSGDSFQNPKKKFCEGVSNKAGQSSDVMANYQIIGKTVSHERDAPSKLADGQSNSDLCVKITENNRNVLDDQSHNIVSSGNRDQITTGSEDCIEALSISSAVTCPSSETHGSFIQIGSPNSSGIMPEVKTSKSVVYFCRCKHQLWIGRKKLLQQLSNKHDLTGLALEQEITNLALKKQSDLQMRIQKAEHSSCQGHQKNQKSETGQISKGKNPAKNPPNDLENAEDKKDPTFSSHSGKGEESAADSTNCKQKIMKAEPSAIEFTCQIFHQNCDTASKLPHILIKLRPSKSSCNQFKNFYCSFRSQIVHLVMEHFSDSYN